MSSIPPGLNGLGGFTRFESSNLPPMSVANSEPRGSVLSSSRSTFSPPQHDLSLGKVFGEVKRYFGNLWGALIGRDDEGRAENRGDFSLSLPFRDAQRGGRSPRFDEKIGSWPQEYQKQAVPFDPTLPGAEQNNTEAAKPVESIEDLSSETKVSSKDFEKILKNIRSAQADQQQLLGSLRGMTAEKMKRNPLDSNENTPLGGGIGDFEQLL